MKGILSHLKDYLVKKDEASKAKHFMKQGYKPELACAAINQRKVECSCCKSDKWTYDNKPHGTEVRIICNTCGHVAHYEYSKLYNILVEEKNKQAKAAEIAAQLKKDEASKPAEPANDAPVPDAAKTSAKAEKIKAIAKTHQRRKRK